MRAELKFMQKRLGTTAIYTTPDQLEALSMADTIAVIDEGRLHQVGTPLEIYNHPADQFVAHFVGDPPMNFLVSSGSLKSEEGKTFLQVDDLHIDISPRLKDLIAQQSRDRFHIGIRPSDITLSHADSGTDWEGEVYLVEQVGRSHIFTIRVNDDMLKVKVSLEFEANVGDRLWLSFNSDKIYLFDEDSGKSI
jgi:multiple sugar transport system ATP-binding protein